MSGKKQLRREHKFQQLLGARAGTSPALAPYCCETAAYQIISRGIMVKLFQKLGHFCYFWPPFARKIDDGRSIHVDSASRDNKTVSYVMQP
jgi:hypothetical protein